MCDKAVNKFFCIFDSILDWDKTQEMCEKVVSKDSFSIRYVPDQCKTQQMCDKAVDNCMAALKLVPHWLVTSKMIKKIFTDLYVDENIVYFNEYFSSAVFNCNEMDILNTDLNNINLRDTNYEEDDPNTIILIRLLA